MGTRGKTFSPAQLCCLLAHAKKLEGLDTFGKLGSCFNIAKPKRNDACLVPEFRVVRDKVEGASTAPAVLINTGFLTNLETE